MSTDPFDEVFTLEDQFYSEGFSQGFKDGAQAGRIEGRSLGMEKGFEKFCEAGRLSAKAVVWLNRLPGDRSGTRPSTKLSTSTSTSTSTRMSTSTSTSTSIITQAVSHPSHSGPAPAATDSDATGQPVQPVQEDENGTCTLPQLPSNPRLEKNIRMLYSLVEPDTFSVENSDEAVQDFDDRVKRAQGKAKIIERVISHR